MSADPSPLRDLDLQELAQAQYGSAAQVVQTGDGLYDWKARVNGQLQGMDFAPYYAKLHGAEYIVVPTGGGAYDWKAVSASLLASRYYAVPLVLVPEEMRGNVAAIRTLVQSVTSILSSMQSFYQHYAGKTFHFIPPLVQLTHLGSAAINNAALQGDSHLLDLTKQAVQTSVEFGRLLDPRLLPTVSVIAFTAVSGVAATGNGGRGDGDKFAVMPPSAIEHPMADWTQITSEAQDGTAYVVFHEGGHAIGMPHTCDTLPGDAQTACKADPSNSRSIMRGDVQYWVKRNGANLGPADVAVILRNPRFS